jgi:ankyrin repeat protein
MRLIPSNMLALSIVLLLSTPAGAETSLDDLLNAAEMGHNAIVIDGVRRGMDVDSCDEAGLSLLMRAAREGNLELVDFLLRNRANVRARTSWGDTAMSLAGQKGQTAVIRRLIEGGGEVNQPGWSAILYAAMEGHVETVKLLLEKGANPDSRAPSQLTPLMIASRNGHIDVVRVLLAAKADPNAQNDRGDTALKWALNSQNTDIGDALRAAGAR